MNIVTTLPLTRKVNRQDKLKKLKNASKEFESVFFYELLKVMRKTVPKDTLLGEGIAEDVFKSMLDTEYSRIMAKSGRWGLADTIYNEFKDKV